MKKIIFMITLFSAMFLSTMANDVGIKSNVPNGISAQISQVIPATVITYSYVTKVAIESTMFILFTNVEKEKTLGRTSVIHIDPGLCLNGKYVFKNQTIQYLANFDTNRKQSITNPYQNQTYLPPSRHVI